MTDRKWRVIEATDRMRFYEKIEKYEELGYILLPESFSVSTYGGHSYYCLMKKGIK